MPTPNVALVCGNLDFRLHTMVQTSASDYVTFLEFAGKYFKVPRARRRLRQGTRSAARCSGSTARRQPVHPGPSQTLRFALRKSVAAMSWV
jgi:hypothetical protein